LGPNFEGLRLELELERLGLGLERLRLDLEKLGVARSLLPHLIMEWHEASLGWREASYLIMSRR
jgi:hypothetical protein